MADIKSQEPPQAIQECLCVRDAVWRWGFAGDVHFCEEHRCGKDHNARVWAHQTVDAFGTVVPICNRHSVHRVGWVFRQVSSETQSVVLLVLLREVGGQMGRCGQVVLLTFRINPLKLKAMVLERAFAYIFTWRGTSTVKTVPPIKKFILLLSR